MKIRFSVNISSKLLICVFGLACFLCTTNAYALDGNYEELLQALESDRFEEFNQLLDNGANSSELVEIANRSRWVNCLAAQKQSDKWLRAIKSHGGDIHQVREELLSNVSKARYANSLLCSVLNFSMEPFKYLLENDADVEQTFCPLCKQETSRRTLLEFATRFAQFNKSAWLLENYPESKQQINDMVIWNLETQPNLRDDRKDGFWRTVDLIRENGHTVNPKVKR